MGRMGKRLARTHLTQQQYDALIQDLRGKIFVTILNIEALLDKNGKIHDIGIATLKDVRYNQGIVSLYTHALEQLGKLIMVKQCMQSGGYYDLSPIKYDFYNHNRKINIALQNLPLECKDIFVNAGQGTQNLNLDLRLQLLHSDIDSNGNIIQAPFIDDTKLGKAISWFKTEQYAH